jgi:ketosteroid isomerase-like protein
MRKETISGYFLLLLGACYFLVSCATPPVTPVALKDYKSASPEEAAIVAVVIAFEECLNNADQKRLLSILADEAKMMHGRDKRIMTKKEYVNILPERIKEMGIIKFSNTKTEVSLDTATVKADYVGRAAVLDYLFKLKKFGDKWLIMSNSY